MNHTRILILICSTLIFVFIAAFSAFAQQYKGLYVDAFDKILGNKAKEDSLLNYCKVNGFNALTTYKTKDIAVKYKITKASNGSNVLAAFIKRAKRDFNIVSFAMSSEQFSTFANIVSVYNNSRKDTTERVNAFNFEFEYWNPHSTAPDGYYCKKYLKAAGCSCDTAGAFLFYRRQLTELAKLADEQQVKLEVYVGKPTEGQAQVIAKLVNRLLLDCYLKDPAKGYKRATQRLSYFNSAGTSLQVIPIWGSTNEFMGLWQKQHTLQEADSLFLNDFQKELSAYPNLSIAGFQWYKYSTMKK